MPRLLHTLKSQILLAIGVLTALYATSTLYSLHVIDLQHSDDVLVQLAGRLTFNQQHLTVQAMRYEENAPRDYPSYYRDLRLYFEDLKKTRNELDRIIAAFATNRFDPALTGGGMPMQPQLPKRSLARAQDLQAAWDDFSRQLDARIGPDEQEPRLEWAAETIVQHNAELEEISRKLLDTLQEDVAERAAEANLVNRVLLLTAILLSMGIAFWFYRRVLAPLAVTVDGFKQVANGDFSYRVPVLQDNEIGWLASTFNRLAVRMEALRQLLTRLEQGADLESTLRTLSETLPPLIPVDWIGVLIIGPDGMIHLEKAFSDRKPDPIGKLSFSPDKTLLEECIRSRDPLHIPDVKEVAGTSDAYVFLRRLARLGRRDAIFLPIGTGSAVQGVAVFANRYPNSYRAEHLALLRNLGLLVGVSLARTLQLVESTRLANIGQFASGIVHEIRNPLATIGLAMDHLKGLDGLPQGTRKRVDLAASEVARLERLLADILLYAKPIVLQRTHLDLVDLIQDTVAAESADARGAIELAASHCPPVAADPDRLRQVLINLLHNALQASPDGETVRVRCDPDGPAWVQVEICNGGTPIAEQDLERVFEPFVTSKRGGTGLGLPIVRRIVAAHGGEISLRSDAQRGTRAILRLPAVDAGRTEPLQPDQATA